MKELNRAQFAMAACLTMGGIPVLGQAFNIDCAPEPGHAPASSYGAGASQTGFWNDMVSANLRGLDGNLTTAYFGGSLGGNTYQIPGATGDDEALMESVFDMGSSQRAIIANLTAGPYDVYMYSWGGHVFGPRTVGMSAINGVTSVSRTVTFGSQWPGGQIEGVTYARLPIDVVPGQNYLSLGFDFPGDFNILAGIQLVPVPAPGAPAAALAGGLWLASRRRSRAV